jgi:hypothetical protein
MFWMILQGLFPVQYRSEYSRLNWDTLHPYPYIFQKETITLQTSTVHIYPHLIILTFSQWYTIFGDLKSGVRPLVCLHGGPGAAHK